MTPASGLNEIYEKQPVYSKAFYSEIGKLFFYLKNFIRLFMS